MTAGGPSSAGLDFREVIARRAAKELRDGYSVNLGIGIPTLVANYVDPGIEVVLQSENGLLGVGAVSDRGGGRSGPDQRGQGDDLRAAGIVVFFERGLVRDDSRGAYRLEHPGRA